MLLFRHSEHVSLRRLSVYRKGAVFVHLICRERYLDHRCGHLTFQSLHQFARLLTQRYYS